MSRPITSRELMIEIAQMSFEEGKKNKDISDILALRNPPIFIPARRVQDVIEEAGQWLLRRSERLDQLEKPDSQEHALGQALLKKFRVLIAARVVSGGDTHTSAEYAALMRKYAYAASDYFDDLTHEAEEAGKELKVLVSGGQPILDMVNTLLDRKRPKVHYCAAAIIGRGADIVRAPHVGSETNATVAWSRSGRLPQHLFYGTVAPYLVPEELIDIHDKKKKHEHGRADIQRQMKEMLLSGHVTETLNIISENVDIALAGLGIPYAAGVDTEYSERLTMTGLLKPFGIDPGLLVEEGAVGDISYCLFDENGKGRAAWRFFLTAGQNTDHEDVDFYRNMVAEKKKVIVIGGVRKEAALIPALKAKLLNVLITDAATAQKLLEI